MNELSTDSLRIVMKIIQEYEETSLKIVTSCNTLLLRVDALQEKVYKLEKKFKQWELLGVADENIN